MRETPATAQPAAPAPAREQEEGAPAGPRKLIRPPRPAGTSGRMHSQRALLPLSQPQSAPPASPAGENAHAEISYLQKQIQAQTPMRIVLLDGEQLEGCIEWYDRTSIKIRGRQRVLVYKAAIKYLYKDADGHGGLHLARGL